MTNSVSMDFAIVQGAELIRSAKLDPNADMVRTALQKEPMDGALIISINDSDFLDENMWDSLDLILTGLVEALKELESSANTALVEFPDTRAQLRLTRIQKNNLEISIEGQSAHCVFDEFVLATKRTTHAFLGLVKASTTGRVSSLGSLSDFLAR